MDPAAPSRTSASPTSQLDLSWDHPQGLFGLSLINALLMVLTLGIYSFWAKTEVRKRIWSGVRLNGEPLQYTGTGLELFKGFLIAFFVVFVPVIATVAWAALTFGPDAPATGVVQVVVYVAFIFLYFVAAYRALRYRLSRTLWRGIRGGLDGSSTAYAGSSFWRLIANILTLGWLTPVNAVHLQGMMTNNMRFGSKPFSFNAMSGPLYARFAVAWFGVLGTAVLALFLSRDTLQFIADMAVLAPGQPPPSSVVFSMLGLYLMVILAFVLLYTWYSAFQFRHFAQHTHYMGATFKSTVTGRGFIWITVSNYLIVLLSLGILTPIAQARLVRYLVTNLAIEGDVPLDDIMQGAADTTSTGEGLAQAFDVDGF